MFAKLLVGFFAAVKMQIISNIFLTILEFKITIFYQKGSFRGANLTINVKMGDFDPQNDWKYFYNYLYESTTNIKQT